MLGMDKEQVFEQIKEELRFKKSQTKLIEDEQLKEETKTLFDNLEEAMEEGNVMEAINISKRLKEIDKQVDWS